MSKSFVTAWNKYRHEVRAELAVARIESPADIVWAVGHMLWKHSADSGVVARMDKLHVMAHDDAVTYQFDTGGPVAYVVRFWTQSDLFVSVEECISDSLSWKPDKAALDTYMEFARQVVIHLQELPAVVATGYVVRKYTPYDSHKYAYWRAEHLDYAPHRNDATVFLAYAEASHHVPDGQKHEIVPVDWSDEVLR